MQLLGLLTGKFGDQDLLGQKDWQRSKTGNDYDQNQTGQKH